MTNKNRDWAGDLVHDIDCFIQHVSAEMTPDEMFGDKDVPWKELVLRMNAEDVEKAFAALQKTTDEFTEYFYHEDPCPGMPVHK